MTLKYTKGEWLIDGSQIVTGFEPTDETICDINPNTEYPTVYQRNEDESFANAKLIASAPDMYETLRELLSCYEKDGHLLNFNVNNARQAIKKIES